MINTAKIRGRIAEKGKTIQLLAPIISCSAYTLGKKISNKAPITLAEVSALCEELEIQDDEFAEFFLMKELQKCNE